MKNKYGMITVYELIEQLEEICAASPLGKNLMVVLARDEEGNGFSPLWAPTIGQYTAETMYTGDFYGDDGNEPDIDNNAVCLWPTN